MSRYVSEHIGRQVVSRAGNRCEYCRITIADTYFGGEIDHIKSVKHGGDADLENLALACQPCNRNKGTDLGSTSPTSGELVRFFNPRIDDWGHHFRFSEEGHIEGLTSIGAVTAAILQFNIQERAAERRWLIEQGRVKNTE